MSGQERSKGPAQSEARRFLPMTMEEMHERGWERPDFVYVIGDAYVDHSSFGPAIISRVLESRGYKVGIIAQPDWRDENSIAVLGEPRLGFLVSAGNMDSMVNHYTVNKKPRSEDAYSPGGKAGKRPDYATIVYCNLINRHFRNCPVIIGGIEASLRRLAHYDYWSDKLKRSILLDSGADLLLYGMGELSIIELADALDSGMDIRDITYIPGTVWKARDVSQVAEGIRLPDYETMQKDRLKYAESFYTQYRNADFSTGRPLIESYGPSRYVVANPPQRPLSMQEMDDIYELPYTVGSYFDHLLGNALDDVRDELRRLRVEPLRHRQVVAEDLPLLALPRHRDDVGRGLGRDSVIYLPERRHRRAEPAVAGAAALLTA